jgi:molecular chaperone DnaK
VEKMKADAEKYAEDDKQKKELAEARNQANSVAFEMEKQLKEYGDKLEAKDKETIEENVKKLKELAGKEDASAEELKKATDETLNSAQKIAQVMQAQQQAGGAEGAGGADGSAGAGEPDAADDDKKDAKKSKGEAEEGEVINE